jgi:LAO/AO transport system kinase
MSISSPTPDSTLWIPPIVKTVATEGKGIDELAAAIAKHVEHLRQSGDWDARDRARLGSEMETLLREALMDRFLENIQQQRYQEMLEKVLNRHLSPSEAVTALLNGNLK